MSRYCWLYCHLYSLTSKGKSHGLQIEGPLLIDQVASNHVGNIVPCHHIPMHKDLAVWTVQAPDFHLSHKLLTHRALFGGVVFIHTNHDVAQGPHLAKSNAEYAASDILSVLNKKSNSGQRHI